jgi:hypothetical protein
VAGIVQNARDWEVGTKQQAKTERELLGDATNNLLRALKQNTRKKESRACARLQFQL